METPLKLLYEEREANVEVSFEMNESKEKTKKYKIKGVFSTIGEKNRNGRIYPKSIWESAVGEYQKYINGGDIRSLCEWEHPERTEIDPMQAVAVMKSLKVENGNVIGEAVLLDNEKANQLKCLIDNGIKISVSSRGVGSVNREGIVENYELITYDFVAYPSDYNATMNGLYESKKTFYRDENGNLLECVDKKEPVDDDKVSKSDDNADIQNIDEKLQNSVVTLEEKLIEHINTRINEAVTELKSQISESDSNVKIIEAQIGEITAQIDLISKPSQNKAQDDKPSVNEGFNDDKKSTRDAYLDFINKLI